MSDAKLLGYWISVTDEDSARDAVRMSGLPILVMGANAALLALLIAVRPLPDTGMIASAAVIATLLILLAFRIRAGHAAWIPFVLILFVAFLAASQFSAYIGWRLAGETPTASAHILLSWIVPAICTILMINGFQGWLWMRANGKKRSF